MSPSLTQQFWIDEMGYLWCGPLRDSQGNPEWKRFEGVDPRSCKPMWRWRRELKHQDDGGESMPPLQEVSREQAIKIIGWYVFDAKSRKGQK